tara:strand:+ start:315 stop:572 length:258 start_codon:yes stop_codon:yes gene_type:complete
MPWTNKVDQDRSHSLIDKENLYEPASLKDNSQSEIMQIYGDNQLSALEALKKRGQRSTKRLADPDIDIYQQGTNQTIIDDDYNKA